MAPLNRPGSYICSEGPASQPSGVALPVTRTSNYLWHGAPATETETSGAVARTATTSFNPQARPVTVTTAVTGLPGSTPVPAVTTGLCQVSWTGVLLVRPRQRSEVGGQRRGPRLGFGSRGWSGGGVGCRTPRCIA